MADGLDPKNMAVILLLISVFFHYFSYSFTVVAYDYSFYDVSLDLNELYASGIMLGANDEHNITFDAGTWTEYNLSNKVIRTQWQDWAFLTTEDPFDFDSGMGFAFQTRADFFGFDTYQSFYLQNIEKGRLIRNETVIALFDRTVNHTRVMSKTGHVLFFTDPLKEGNITRAIQENGIVTLTIAENMNWATDENVRTFVSWYVGLVTGSESWGLPPSFNILVKVMSLLGIFSGMWLLIEARRI